MYTKDKIGWSEAVLLQTVIIINSCSKKSWSSLTIFLYVLCISHFKVFVGPERCNFSRIAPKVVTRAGTTTGSWSDFWETSCSMFKATTRLTFLSGAPFCPLSLFPVCETGAPRPGPRAPRLSGSYHNLSLLSFLQTASLFTFDVKEAMLTTMWPKSSEVLSLEECWKRNHNTLQCIMSSAPALFSGQLFVKHLPQCVVQTLGYETSHAPRYKELLTIQYYHIFCFLNEMSTTRSSAPTPFSVRLRILPAMGLRSRSSRSPMISSCRGWPCGWHPPEPECRPGSGGTHPQKTLQ